MPQWQGHSSCEWVECSHSAKDNNICPQESSIEYFPIEYYSGTLQSDLHLLHLLIKSLQNEIIMRMEKMDEANGNGVLLCET